MAEPEVITRANSRAERLETAFPLPTDPRFDEHLIALDEGFAPARTGLAPKHRARSLRVLALALFAVFAVLIMTNAAVAAAWGLSGEQYVDEIIRANF